MTFQIDAPTLSAAQQAQASGDYAGSYRIVQAYLIAHYPAASRSTDDRDVMAWLQTAINVNSGAHTLGDMAVRENNTAAICVDNGRFI